MNSVEYRNSELFLRNNCASEGIYDIPIIRKQKIDLENVDLIACTDIRNNDSSLNVRKGVHFFVDDYRFNGIYNNPQRTLKKYSQYKFLLSPDFSIYADMPRWKQIENVAKNRWCGAYWQNKGLIVVPTVSWSDFLSYEFCFNGIEKEAIVAIGMIGCKGSRRRFMRGYNEMLCRIEPEQIICFGTPFPEMKGNICVIDYISSRKAIR